MARRKARKAQNYPWNKGVKTGQRDPFSRSDVGRIKRLLAKRGDAGLRDLALFSTSIDTMLRVPDLLGLTVKDVRQRNRVMRDTVDLTSADGERRIQCTLSNGTMNVLDQWINLSGKRPSDYLFTGQTGGRSKAITARQFSRLVKFWASDIGLDASLYGTESLRRTFEQVAGRDLRWFFDQWVYGAGFPALTVRVEWDEAAKTLIWRVRQGQPTRGAVGLFRFAVEVEAVAAAALRLLDARAERRA